MIKYLSNHISNLSIVKLFSAISLISILLILYFILLLSPSGFIYDEILFVKNITFLEQYGFGQEFLLNLRDQAPGPLYQLFHKIFQPFTLLDPIKMRLLNFSLFGTLILFGLKYSNAKSDIKSFAYLLVFLSVPIIFPIMGMSLTEMPAMILLLFSLLLLHSALRSNNCLFFRSLLFIISGIFMSLAIAGRTQFLMILVPSFFLFPLQKNRGLIILFLLISLALPAFMFRVWNGLTPPLLGDLNDGLNFSYGLLALSYLSVMIFFVAYSWFDFSKKTIIIAFLTSLIFIPVNIAFKFVEFVPFKSVIFSICRLPLLVNYYKYMAPGILMIPIVFFFQSSLRNIILYKADNWKLFLFFSILLITLTSVKSTHQFSSRYVVQCFPLIMLLLHERIKINYFQLVISVVGLIIGFSSLYSYYTFPF